MDENRTSSKLIKLVKKLGGENSSEVLLPVESIEVGFSTKAVLRKLKTTEKPLERAFRNDVRQFVISTLQKIIERSPLKYQLTRSIASLSPIEIATMSDDTLIAWFDSWVSELNTSGLISTLEGEKVEKQYKNIITNKDR